MLPTYSNIIQFMQYIVNTNRSAFSQYQKRTNETRSNLDSYSKKQNTMNNNYSNYNNNGSSSNNTTTTTTTTNSNDVHVVRGIEKVWAKELYELNVQDRELITNELHGVGVVSSSSSLSSSSRRSKSKDNRWRSPYNILDTTHISGWSCNGIHWFGPNTNIPIVYWFGISTICKYRTTLVVVLFGFALIFALVFVVSALLVSSSSPPRILQSLSLSSFKYNFGRILSQIGRQ